MKISILVVEDNEALRNIIVEETAAQGGYDVRGVESAEEALDLLDGERFDVLVTDINLPGMTGLELLRHCQRLHPGLVPVVITAYGTIEKAVEAMKCGASDFIEKPFQVDTLLSAVEVAVRRVERRDPADADAAQTQTLPPGVVAESESMRRVFDEASKLAPSRLSVLITGETGTGKEVVAQAIHRMSPRAHRRFVALNCAAIPENLLEDEIFGHVKGAFTGAQTAREGRFEQADGGTLFLDEIGDMAPDVQSKLLRVLQTQEFERVGSSKTVKVDVRVIAATSADLEQGMKQKTFREDLFYRLNVARLRLPPLRERPADIHPLAQHLLAKFTEEVGFPVKSLSDETIAALLAHGWPGNVRQLQNAVERAAVMSGARNLLIPADLPQEVLDGSPAVTPLDFGHDAVTNAAAGTAELPETGVNFSAVVSKVERELLLKSLNKSGGNKMRAAEWLGMKRTTFVEKLKRLNIETVGEEGD